MSNIISSGAQNANQATAPTPRVNDVPVATPDGRNYFDMSFDNYLTARYGTILPFHYFQAFEGDKVNFSSRHEVRSYTMSAPWMGSAYLHKHYFAVPMPAILRRNWAKIQVQPIKGDDVPRDANCVDYGKSTIFDYVRGLWNSHVYGHGDTSSWTSDEATAALRAMILTEALISVGSLPRRFNLLRERVDDIKLRSGSSSYSIYLFDNLISDGYDEFFRSTDLIVGIYENTGYEEYTNSSEPSQSNTARYVSTMDLLDKMRSNPFYIKSAESFSSIGRLGSVQLSIQPAASLPRPDLNYQYLIAYHCVCSQFYTNDHVDNLYTWELYEQAQEYLQRAAFKDVDPTNITEYPSFVYNGTRCLYDVFSGHNINLMFSLLSKEFALSNLQNHHYVFDFCVNFLTARRSLVYGDYFHAAKTTPLAAVDVNAPVVSSKVSAIDMTKSIIMQRFGNAVQKAGQRFADYVKDVIGGHVSPDYHEPKWIIGNTFVLGANEIENTADKQGNVVQNIRTTADNWAYETEFGMQSIVLGLFFFNTPFVYSNFVPRENLQVDRFDFFNVRLQNIGDQPIDFRELCGSVTGTFGYQTRNADMKQRVSICSGGFLGFLPSWVFRPASGISYNHSIDSEFIRDNPNDFDAFYSSLSNLSLGGRFHMIFKFSNQCGATRNMQITPTIL